MENTDIKFLVNDWKYKIPLEHIRNFPIKTALINQLTEKYLDGSFGIEISPENEIIIKLPKSQEELDSLDQNNCSKFTCHRNNFKKVVKIYENPKITLFELLELENLCTLLKDYSEDIENEKLKDDLETSLEYNFIRKSNYDNFMQELDFYGIPSLFQSSSLRNEIDHQSMVERFHENLENLFPSEVASRNFFSQILALGGTFSGSFLLQAILKENWKDKPKDLDVYVNIGMLDGMLGHRTVSASFYGFESKYEMKYWQLIAEKVRKLLGAKTAIVVDKSTPPGYNFTSDIVYVIKIEMEKFNLDFIVIATTVPYFIDKNFDFDFCKVYYDGYVIHAIDWNPILNRCSIDRRRRNYPKGITAYANNHARIEKYMKRGFIITTIDTGFTRIHNETIK